MHFSLKFATYYRHKKVENDGNKDGWDLAWKIWICSLIAYMCALKIMFEHVAAYPA